MTMPNSDNHFLVPMAFIHYIEETECLEADDREISLNGPSMIHVRVFKRPDIIAEYDIHLDKGVPLYMQGEIGKKFRKIYVPKDEEPHEGTFIA